MITSHANAIIGSFPNSNKLHQLGNSSPVHYHKTGTKDNHLPLVIIGMAGDLSQKCAGNVSERGIQNDEDDYDDDD